MYVNTTGMMNLKLMVDVRPSFATFCPPVTIHSVKAQKVKIYIYLIENLGSYEVNTL
jgi:hypothetical protein